jgi:hypothetical protein
MGDAYVFTLAAAIGFALRSRHSWGAYRSYRCGARLHKRARCAQFRISSGRSESSGVTRCEFVECARREGSRLFRRPMAADLPFLACPKKGKPKKGHPGSAPSLREGARRAGGVFRQHIHVLTENGRASRAAPFGLIHRPAAAAHGTRDQEQRQTQQQRQRQRQKAKAKRRQRQRAGSRRSPG